MNTMPDSFTSKVQRQIERLRHCSYQAIEAEVAQKRLAWFRQHEQITTHYDHPTPRQDFDRLFFDYLGLSPDELPIVSETETEIVWQSANPCPTLEAEGAGPDTRTVAPRPMRNQPGVCVATRSTVEVSAHYEEIRPYASYCREMIVRAWILKR
jgi:hypothetical protein